MIKNIKKKKLITSFIILLALTLCLIFFSSANSLQKYEIKYKFYANQNISQLNSNISFFLNYNITKFYFRNKASETNNEKFLDLEIEKLPNSTVEINKFKNGISEDVLNNLRDMKISSELDINSLDVIKEKNQKKFIVTFHSKDKKNTNYYTELIKNLAYVNYMKEIDNFNLIIKINNKFIQSLQENVDTIILKNFNNLLETNYYYLNNINKDSINEIITIEQLGYQKKIAQRKYISLIEFLSVLLAMLISLVLLYFKKIYLIIFSER